MTLRQQLDAILDDMMNIKVIDADTDKDVTDNKGKYMDNTVFDVYPSDKNSLTIWVTKEER